MSVAYVTSRAAHWRKGEVGMTLIRLGSPKLLARSRTSPMPLVSLLRMLASMASLPGNSASSASVGREATDTD